MEQVLAVKTDLLSACIYKNGIITENCDRIIAQIRQNAVFLPRPEAEADPAYKQIISYVIIRRGKDVFSTCRLNKGGESRLHGLISLGIGGHINPVDACNDILEHGMRRELEEEVALSTEPLSLTPIGFINDDKNDVGKVHLGMLSVMDVPLHCTVTVREVEKLAGCWLPIASLSSHLAEMETWSQIACTALGI